MRGRESERARQSEEQKESEGQRGREREIVTLKAKSAGPLRA